MEFSGKTRSRRELGYLIVIRLSPPVVGQLPVHLEDTDLAILRSLIEDGRKSFRAISREIKVSAPTVKARYELLVNMGLITSVKPEIDMSKVGRTSRKEYGKTLELLKKEGRHFHLSDKGLSVRMKCEFCGGLIHYKPKVLRFANYERFFCCNTCRSSYKDRHGGRIEMIKERYRKSK